MVPSVRTVLIKKSPSKQPHAPMQLSMASKPMERIAMDILGPLPTTSRSNKYILVVGDYFSNGKKFTPCQIWRLLQSLFCWSMNLYADLECPNIFYRSKKKASLIKEMCQLLGIKKKKKKKNKTYHALPPPN